MNINRPTGYDEDQIGMKQSETVNNVLICEQQSPPPAPTVTETVVVQKETAYAPFLDPAAMEDGLISCP